MAEAEKYKRRPLTNKQRESRSRRNEREHKVRVETEALRRREEIVSAAKIQTHQSIFANRAEAYKANRQAQVEAAVAQHKALKQAARPTLRERATENETSIATESVRGRSISATGIIFRVLAVLVGMAILYNLVRNQGQGGSKVIQSIGKTLTSVTAGQPMFQPV